MFFPSIIETTGRSTKSFDLPSKLLQERIIYLAGPITQESANIAIMQLLWLNSVSEDPINLYINSPGGEVYQGLAIKDVIHSIKAPVNTVGFGLCASMGSYLLAAGTGTRKASNSCRIMIHSVSSGYEGTFHDIEVDYLESKYLQDLLLADLQSFTNMSKEQLEEKAKRDYYMNVDEAIELGIIDFKL